jgi:hypothetical protein
VKEGFIIHLVCCHGGCCFTLALSVLLVISQVPSKVFHQSLSEARLFVCFVLSVLMRSTEPRMLQIPFLVSLESSRGGGVHGLGSMTFGLVVQKFLNNG